MPFLPTEVKALGLHIGRFAIFLIGYFALSLAFNMWALSAHDVEWAEQPRILIVGDSHVYRGVDPSDMRSAVNIGQPSESMPMSYYVLREVLSSSPEVRRIILGLGAHNILRRQDRLLSEDDLAPEFLDRYWGIVDWSEVRAKGISVAPKALLAMQVRKLWVPNPHLVHDVILQARDQPRTDHPYLGFYDDRRGSNLTPEAMSTVMDRHYPERNRDDPISDAQIEYLCAILSVSADAGVEVVLLNTPLHPAYRARVPAKVQGAFDTVWRQATALPHVRGIDLSDLNLPDSAFADYDHVNAIGAEHVTRILVDSLASWP